MPVGVEPGDDVADVVRVRRDDRIIARLGQILRGPIERLDERRRIVDLTDVTFVDESGEALLRRLDLSGAEIVTNGGVETRDVLDNLRAGGICNIRKFLARPDDCG